MLSKIFLILAVLLISINCQTNITTCDELFTVISGDLTLDYQLNQTIDCSMTMIPGPIGTAASPFTGSLNGLNNKIFNLTLSSAGNLVGIFAAANNSRFSNIVLQDCSVTGSADVDGLALLVGGANNVTFTGITINTQNRTQNMVSATQASNVRNVGSVAGYLQGGSITSITVINTMVSAPAGNGVGGVVGWAGFNNVATTANTIYNVGFSNSSLTIVDGFQNVGGIFGLLTGTGQFTRSGVTAGVVNGRNGAAGGVAGDVQDATLVDQIYTRPGVSVTYASGNAAVGCGGMAGFFQTTVSATFTISNCYSRASSVSCNSTVGGFVGQLFNGTNGAINVSISNVYAATAVNSVDAAKGALIGNSTFGTAGVTVSAAFFDNSIANGTIGSGLSCANLFNTVSSTFNNATWGADRLRIEYQFAAGTCNCNGGCATPAPTTAPTTAPTSTPRPSSAVSTAFSVAILALILLISF